MLPKGGSQPVPATVHMHCSRTACALQGTGLTRVPVTEYAGLTLCTLSVRSVSMNSQ